MAYQVYKSKSSWFIMETLANFSFIITETFILAFAAYYRLALIWAVYLALFVFHAFKSLIHFKTDSDAIRKNYKVVGRHEDKVLNVPKEQYPTQEPAQETS